MKHALLLLGAPLALSAFLVSGRPEAGSATASVKPVKPATPSTPATAIARKAPAEEQAPTPPLRLSDPDGQEMRLEGLSARAAVHGMLSLTELELTFRNPHPRRMEGRFTCDLPPGAAISRFAKEVNGRLMEGEVVERLRANRVYDEILHQMRDPALLEQDQGNRFSARVFPIEANATVRLVLSWSRLLPLEEGRRTYTLPLRGLPTMERFTFHALLAPLPGEAAEQRGTTEGTTLPAGARHGSVETVDMDEVRFTPKDDVVISWRRAPGAPAVDTLVAGDFALAAFHPSLPKPAPDSKAAWLFFVDTSASSAQARLERIAALEALLASLPKDDAVEIHAFDQVVEPLGRATAASWAGRLRPALESRAFLGGTDLAAALDALAAAAGRAPGTRAVLVSDGVATLGTTEGSDLLAAAGRLPKGTPLHALVFGNRQDAETLEALTRGRGRVVSLPFAANLAAAARDAAAALRRPLGVELTVEAADAEWSFPSRFADVASGSELIVLSRLKPGAEPSARLLSGRRELLRTAQATPLSSAAFGPLLAREAWRAYLAHLAERERTEPSPAVREALATEQVRVSVDRRILVPRTTLLVLESEEDYRRFGLDRRSLGEILTVGATGIERADRAPVAVSVSRERQEPVKRDAAANRDGRAELALPKPNEPVDDAKETGAKDGFAGGVAGGIEERIEQEVARGAASGAAGSFEAKAEGTVAAIQPVVLAGDFPVAADGERASGGAGSALGGPPLSFLGDVAAAPPEASRPVASASAPMPAIASPPATTRRVPVPITSRLAPDWTRPVVPTAEEVARLDREVEASPLSREGWNRLSEAFAARKEWKKLLDLARRWQDYDPENPQVYECWGEAALALGRTVEARRAFGSLAEVAPGKPELLQRAGLLLFRAGAARLAEAPLRQALKIRPDRANASRHLALVLWQTGRYADAARVLEEASARDYPGWYRNVRRVLLEELGLVYRGWIAHVPGKRTEIERRARERGVDLARRDALRVTLAWETDANDVDLHVVDPSGEECYYGHLRNESGLELYEDVTQGLGPEVIRTSKARPGVHSVGVNYFAAGPMGVARGILVVTRDDGRDGAAPSVEILPFRLVPEGRDLKLLARVEADGRRGQS
ncbi:MAG: hypothetical protein IPN83_06425 [Holophagales bacterium]|nr:hypothetical protein [Holophagales bacterium]